MIKYLLGGLLFPGLVWAAAPDSIANRVYRENFAVASLRTATEKTILFHAGGRFTFLKMASVNFVATEYGGRVVLNAPPGDGTYTYRKTAESAGTIELRFDQGESETLSLQFTSESAGMAMPGRSSTPDSTFSLTDLSEVGRAPAANISMRGRVGAGQPLIAGFVVPGERLPPASRPNATQRDVLIRVVGPSLSTFGVANPWADPDFELFAGAAPANVAEFKHSDWSALPAIYNTSANRAALMAGFRRIFQYVGAFPLPNDSKDAAAVVRLAPGAYTIVAQPAASDAGGETLIEVYFLP
jgi:hypothetical protein